MESSLAPKNPSLAFSSTAPGLTNQPPQCPAGTHVWRPQLPSHVFRKLSANPSMRGFILSPEACLHGWPSPPLG